QLVAALRRRLVPDLRAERGRARSARPAAFADAGVESVALSLIPEEGRPLPETEEDVDPLIHIYLGYLRDRADYVVAAVRRFAAAGPTPVPCAAGQGRTGGVRGPG